ncbi:MAG: carboxypeptidase regulatory-like domain-containing protein [Planctomycetes bacterium]|nr:carboxypeptidase regulatory-like domain-containing protein [Planctomycetota bacterium]
MRRRCRGFARAAVVGCWIALLSGCGPQPLKTVPLSGKVTVNGKPAARAKVFFTPTAPGKTVLPSAETAADGTFRVSTLVPDDGLPPGEYAVTVIWPIYSPGGDQEVEGPDRLKGRYNDVRNPAAKVVVTEGQTELPVLELRTQ